MSHPFVQTRRKEQAAAAVTGAGNSTEFLFGGPVLITRVGFTVTVLLDTDNAVAFTYGMFRRPTLLSAAGQVSCGTFSAAPANLTRAIGSVLTKKLAISPAQQTGEDGKPRNVAPSAGGTPFETGQEQFYIPPGQSFALVCDTNAEADAGSGFFWVEYIELPWNGFFVDQATIFEDVSNLPS